MRLTTTQRTAALAGLGVLEATAMLIPAVAPFTPALFALVRAVVLNAEEDPSAVLHKVRQGLFSDVQAAVDAKLGRSTF